MKVVALPKLIPCHACGHEYAGAICHRCKTERPAFTALKRITSKSHHGIAPLRDPQACKYFPKSICGCDGRYTCLEAA